MKRLLIGMLLLSLTTPLAAHASRARPAGVLSAAHARTRVASALDRFLGGKIGHIAWTITLHRARTPTTRTFEATGAGQRRVQGSVNLRTGRVHFP